MRYEVMDVDRARRRGIANSHQDLPPLEFSYLDIVKLYFHLERVAFPINASNIGYCPVVSCNGILSVLQLCG